MLQTTQVHIYILTIQMCMSVVVCVCVWEKRVRACRKRCFTLSGLFVLCGLHSLTMHTYTKKINKNTYIYAYTYMRLCVPVCDSYPNYVLGSTAHARITNSCSGADLSIFPFSQRVLIRQLYKTRKETTKTHAKRRDKHDKRWNKISTALGHGQIKLSKTKHTTKPPVPGEKQNEDVNGARRVAASSLYFQCIFLHKNKSHV